jgi:hypothetical protein
MATCRERQPYRSLCEWIFHRAIWESGHNANVRIVGPVSSRNVNGINFSCGSSSDQGQRLIKPSFLVRCSFRSGRSITEPLLAGDRAAPARLTPLIRTGIERTPRRKFE